MRDRIGFLSLLGLAFLVALFFSFGLAQVLGASGIKAPRTNLDVLELFINILSARIRYVGLKRPRFKRDFDP